MKLLAIFLNDLKITSRNWISMVLLISLPILMISLMGNALKPAFESGKTVNKIEAAYVNKDKGAIGSAFDNYLNSYAKDYIKLIPVSEDNIENYVSSGKSDIAIVVPENLSTDFTSRKKASISVISSGKDQIKSTVVQSVVNSYIDYLNNQSNYIKAYQTYAPNISDIEASKHVSSLLNRYSGKYISDIPDKSQNSNNSSFQYFAASMLLFFLLYTGIGVGSSILSDRSDKTYMRINSFPVTDNQYLVSKILGNAVISVSQVLVVILFTKFVFNVNWENITGVAVVIILVMLISSSSGILLSSILGSSKSLSSALSIIFWIVAFLGGGFSAIPALEPIGRYDFYKWALNSLSSFMAGGSFMDVSSDIILLVLLSFILWTAGIVLYKRRVSYE